MTAPLKEHSYGTVEAEPIKVLPGPTGIVTSDQAAELAEHFDTEQPCGGNLEDKGQCPFDAAADFIMTNPHCNIMRHHPVSRKCTDCYINFGKYNQRFFGTDMWLCVCGYKCEEPKFVRIR